MWDNISIIVLSNVLLEVSSTSSQRRGPTHYKSSNPTCYRDFTKVELLVFPQISFPESTNTFVQNTPGQVRVPTFRSVHIIITLTACHTCGWLLMMDNGEESPQVTVSSWRHVSANMMMSSKKRWNWYFIAGCPSENFLCIGNNLFLYM